MRAKPLNRLAAVALVLVKSWRFKFVSDSFCSVHAHGTLCTFGVMFLARFTVKSSSVRFPFASGSCRSTSVTKPTTRIRFVRQLVNVQY